MKLPERCGILVLLVSADDIQVTATAHAYFQIYRKTSRVLFSDFRSAVLGIFLRFTLISPGGKGAAIYLRFAKLACNMLVSS